MTKKKQNKYGKTYGFRGSYELDETFIEILGTDVNSSCKKIVEDILLLDVDDVYDVRIFVNNKKIEKIKVELDSIESKKENLETELKQLTKIETDLQKELSEIQKDTDEYISNKKKYKENSMINIINKILLVYTKDEIEFDVLTIQELIIASKTEYKQDLIINNVLKFLDNNRYKEITIKDEKSDDKKMYTIELTDAVVKHIKTVLNGLIIEKK